MQYAKESMLGYKTVQDAQDGTHVIMTKDEYDELRIANAVLVKDLDKMRDAYRELRDNYTAAVSSAASRARAEGREAAQEAAKKEIGQVRQQLAEMQARYEYEKGLNDNLLRISRERANADREIPNKKLHPGFLLLSTREKYYKYKKGYTQQTVVLWETCLQTPFPAKLPFAYADREIMEEAYGLLEDVGINRRYGRPYEVLEKDTSPEWQNWQQYNVFLDSSLKANFQKGYWELTFTHTKPLGEIPYYLLGEAPSSK